MGPAGERCRGVTTLSRQHGPVVVAASVHRCMATAARHHLVAATAARPWRPSTACRGRSLVRWACLPIPPRLRRFVAGAFGPQPKWRRPPPASLVREGGGKRGTRPAPSAATGPPDSGGLGRRTGERSVEWAFEEGHLLHVSHAALETETGMAAAFKLPLVFLPGWRVLVLPEVVRGPREPRPR